MPTYGPYISKVTLPSGNTYDIKDQEARDLIMEITSPGDFLGVTTTDIIEGSTTNPIVIDGNDVTAHNGDWCVRSSDKKAFIFNSNDTWQEFTDMSDLGGLAYKDEASGTVNDYVTGVASASTTVNSKVLKFTPHGANADSAVTFTGTTTDKVLGKDTTFTNGSSSVSFAAHTKENALGTGTTATVPHTAANTKYLTKGNALTGLGTASTDTFVKSYPGTTSKLDLVQITPVSGTDTASKATAGTAKNVATTGTPVNCANGALDDANGQSANTVMWGASVSDETLSFSFKTLHTNPVTPAVSNGTITPYTFADVTVPKAAAAINVVKGLAANGSGATVMTGLGTATTAAAVTGYASPTTGAFVNGSSATSTTGSIQYVESLTTDGTDAVTITADPVSAITALGAATAAAQTITVGTNDIVDVITGMGTATAEAQAWTGTEADLSHDHTASTSVTLTKGNKTITVS